MTETGRVFRRASRWATATRVHRHSWLRRFLTFLLHLAYRIVLRLEVVGLENIPPSGPVILAINHISFLDPVLVVSLLQRKVLPMAKAEVFRDIVLGPLVSAFDAFPVRRGEIDRRAVHTALEVLRMGGVLLIAPEGTRSPTGALIQGKEGAVYLAWRTGAPIVPVGVEGTDRFKFNIRWLRRTPVRVVFGPPLYVEIPEERSREALREATDELMLQIAALLPPERRGIYADFPLATPRYLRPLSPIESFVLSPVEPSKLS
ncbi:MAG: lysophospholipid acyltransferase family protein [Anaerolineae bacterium]|nr:1-acyl-sn-glycerol-3-phosphate acyltransferase [Thermoflexus sp.]MDW8064439.1 lysophospholipid acyltransferase family protein [Anaerolineae bacterium]